MREVDNYMLLAEDSLAQATLLLDNKFYRGASGMAYYAYFDAVRALLATNGIITKSHSAARGLFSNNFVKDGPFVKNDSTLLNDLFELRQAGTYDPDETISESDARKAVDAATEFLLQAEAYLHDTGFAEPEKS